MTSHSTPARRRPPNDDFDPLDVDVCTDLAAVDNSGLIPAVASLLIDLWRKRKSRHAEHNACPYPREGRR
jgi:hypothetical protein